MSKGKSLSVEIRSKPTLFIDSKGLHGFAFKVGKRATVTVKGKITQESLNDYEAPNRRSYRMEIDKISSPKSSRDRFRRR